MQRLTVTPCPVAGAVPGVARGALAGAAAAAAPALVRAAALMALGVACLLLAGCGLLRRDEAEADAASAPPRRPAPAVQVEVRAPGELAKLLSTHLDLARLPPRADAAPGSPGISEAELERQIAQVPAQARELLGTEGYFEPSIDVQRLLADGPRPAVRLVVQPGPRSLVRDVRIDVQGPLADHTREQAPQARAAQRALRHGWPLPPGAPFRNAEWSEGKRDALAQLRAQGYIGAEWAHTRATVHADDRRADLELVVDSGPLFRTGALRIEGLRRHDAQTVRNLADFGPGAIASEQRLLDFQERLANSGLFDAATVQYLPESGAANTAPVLVTVNERTLQEATLGLGIDANVGLRGSLEHHHRRVLGRALTARNRVELSSVRRAWEGELSTHALPGLWRNLVGGAAERIESDTDVVTATRVRVGRAQDKHSIDRLVFVEAERSRQRGPAGRLDSSALSAHYHGIWREVDNVLLPTRGHVLAGQGGGGIASADPGRRGPFARLYARWHYYRPIGRSWHLATRLEAGQVFAREGVVAPESMRFRAGGEESVRGYGYRELAPVVDGQVTGGRVLATASAEMARPLLKRLPELWGAVFVDAGRAADRWSDLKPAVGVGVGLRYRSPIGPVKLDLAYGEEVDRFRLHLTVGATF